MDELWRSEDATVSIARVEHTDKDSERAALDKRAELKTIDACDRDSDSKALVLAPENSAAQLEQPTCSAATATALATTATTTKKRHHDETEPVVWHLSHRPSADKPRKKLTQLDDIAQIGFGGCGGMYNYFLGVASVLQEEYDLTDVIFSGVSAGCFPAMVLALSIDVKEFFFKENIPLIEHAATCSYAGLGKWIPLVKANTLKMLPVDAYKQADKKLYFSVTEVPALKNHVLTTWTSNEDMVDCMLCSGHVPLYTDSLVANYRGKRFVDGGLTNNHPIVYPDRPHKMLQIWKWRWISPTWVLVTTSADWALELFRMGREDALKRLSREIDDAFFTAPAPTAPKRSRHE